MIQLALAFSGIVLMMGSVGWQPNAAAQANDPTAIQLAQLNRGLYEKPVAPEVNPPGDIPDSQVFVTYASAEGHYELQVPEGWARTTKATNVTFVDKLDGLSVSVTSAQTPPDEKSIRTDQAKRLQETGRAVRISHIKAVKVSGRPALLLAYECNSEPNPVTDKQVRLENEVYFFYQDGKLAALRLWAPLGADNVDQWKLISDSFKWR
jgi:hypothetical protein